MWFLFARNLSKEVKFDGYIHGAEAVVFVILLVLHKIGYIEFSGIVIAVAFSFVISAFIGQNNGFRKLSTRVAELEARLTDLEKLSDTTIQLPEIDSHMITNPD